MSLEANIQHRFGDFSLDLNLEPSAGVTALFGRSGSGKSTVINVLNGLLRPDHGTIILDGVTLLNDQINVSPHKRRMGCVFQDARLFPHLNVAQNLDYGTRFAKQSSDISRAQVIELLGLSALLDRRPTTLSGGEKQRVAIGRALLSAPRMLLMDEPLAALDAPRKAEILPYLERLKTDTGLPIIYVSHSMDEIARLADNIVILREGRATTQGPIFDVLSDPKNIPMLGVREAGALVRAKVISHGADGISTLSIGAETLDLPGVDATVGSIVRLRILAQDIILALDAPTGLSAMNVLPVTITSIQDGAGPGAAIQLNAGGEHLLARVTSRSVQRMGLKPQMTCYAIVKAMAVAPEAIGHG
ncbi:MAG: molybdenum ABC transporter ATP-binding protein [Paracoccaceae bacterium]